MRSRYVVEHGLLLLHLITQLPAQKASQNAEDIESFAERIKKLEDILKNATTRDTPLSKPMLDRIDRMSKYVYIS